METNQIYALVNEVNKQALGQGALAVVDSSTLVAMGNTVLASGTNVDLWTGTLVQQVADVIMSERLYTSKFKGLELNASQYGAIIQKIRVEMPDAIEDDAYNLVDGESVDQWKVYKPKVHQKLFAKRTPYSYPLTVTRDLLKESFTSADRMSAFVGYVNSQVRNKIELTSEKLGRSTMNHFAGTLSSAQKIHMLTDYNAEFNETLTVAEAWNDEAFLRWSVALLESYSNKLTDFSVLYNGGGAEKFTGKEKQRFVVLEKFQNRLRSVVQWKAFNPEYVEKTPNIVVNYWQASQAGSEADIVINNGTATVTLENVVAIISDVDAYGMFREEGYVLNTGMNAKGSYMNTYWHEKQLWFNDHDENGLIFLLD